MLGDYIANLNIESQCDYKMHSAAKKWSGSKSHCSFASLLQADLNNSGSHRWVRVRAIR